MAWEVPGKKATDNQLSFVASLIDQLLDLGGMSEADSLEYFATIADDTTRPTFEWASETIEELKAQIAAHRRGKNGSNAPLASASDKGRLTPPEKLVETPSERVKRIYRVAWANRGLSPDGFYKRWEEKGQEILVHHGVEETQEDAHYDGRNPLNEERGAL